MGLSESRLEWRVHFQKSDRTRGEREREESVLQGFHLFFRSFSRFFVSDKEEGIFPSFSCRWIFSFSFFFFGNIKKERERGRKEIRVV